VKGVEVSHHPIVMNLHFLKVKFAVVGIEGEIEVDVAIFVIALFDEFD
jgi:hypothetical protein